jgi:hypothetical protein
MFRRRRSVAVSPELLEAFASFRQAVDAVEEAKRRLASAAPGGRTPGIPLVEALAGFEEGLRDAAGEMPGWRRAEVEDVWLACAAALEESGRRAARLRLGDVPEGYEQLYGTLGDLMDPLVAFGEAVERFRELGA